MQKSRCFYISEGIICQILGSKYNTNSVPLQTLCTRSTVNYDGCLRLQWIISLNWTILFIIPGDITLANLFVRLNSKHLNISLVYRDRIILNPFLPNVPFRSSWKHQITKGFLMFSRKGFLMFSRGSNGNIRKKR